MRDEAVPCVNATKYEIDHGEHMTWVDDRICKPCQSVLDRFNQRRMDNDNTEIELAMAEAAEMIPLPET